MIYLYIKLNLLAKKNAEQIIEMTNEVSKLLYGLIKSIKTNSWPLTPIYFWIMSDIKLKIIDREGVLHEVDAPTDMNMNLMEVVRSYELAPEGTIGICGGMAMCASCQCYVLSDHQLPEKSDDEEAMLSEAFFVKDNSRLGCQIHMTDDLDGLEVELAPAED